MTERSIRHVLVVLVLLQAAVLLALPLRAGPRIPSGTTATLAASQLGGKFEKLGDELPSELFLDYGFDELDLPEGVGPGDVVYVELRGTDGDRAARFGRVVRDEADLPEGATWIRLPVYGMDDRDVELGSGAIEAWHTEDYDRVEELRSYLDEDSDHRVLVEVELDNDGDPTIAEVRSPSS